jgi:hypothetical protein
MQVWPRYRHLTALLVALLVAGFLPASRAGTILSDNLSAASAGTETATGDTWLTSSFGTDSSAYTLSSVTLLLAGSGQAEVDIYSDGGLQPGSLLGMLVSPGSYSITPTDTTFTTSGITLDADSTYWVVLHALTGSFDWSWTFDDAAGTGVGYQDTWGQSQDAGATWFTFNSSPTQMAVTASAVPEPGPIILCAAGAMALLLRRGLRWARPGAPGAARPPC